MHWTQKNAWCVYHVESVSKKRLVLSITFFAIYGVTCVELSHSSLGDWKDIFITHLIIIIKSEVSTFPIVVTIFPWLCVSDGCAIIFCNLFHICPGTLGPSIHYLCSVYGICKWSDTLVLFVCLQITPSHYHHYANLSEGIELTKMLVGYMLLSVCLRLRQLSHLHFVQYKYFVSSACLILLWWSWECVLYLIVIIKSEVWIIGHCLGLGHETMVYAVCLTMFLSRTSNIIISHLTIVQCNPAAWLHQPKTSYLLNTTNHCTITHINSS